MFGVWRRVYEEIKRERWEKVWFSSTLSSCASSLSSVLVFLGARDLIISWVMGRSLNPAITYPGYYSHVLIGYNVPFTASSINPSVLVSEIVGMKA